MKIAIFGKHPVPQPGFEGVMSLYEAKWFSEFGHAVDLLIPFESLTHLNELCTAKQLRDFDSLEKLGSNFRIKPILPGDLRRMPAYDVGIWQSYTPGESELFGKEFKQRCHILSKNFPKLVGNEKYIHNSSVTNQFKAFDHLAFALMEDVQTLKLNDSFFTEHEWQVSYVPRGADPELLNTEHKSPQPCLGFDAPVGSDPRATQHIADTIALLKDRVPDLRVLSLNKDYENIETEKIPFGDFRFFYHNFMNPLWVYMTINYRYSPSHLVAAQRLENPEWNYKAIYEVQNVECQMAGVPLVGHPCNIIAELYEKGRTGFEFDDFENTEEIASIIERIFNNYDQYAKACRDFAIRNHSWEVCIKKWEQGLLNIFENHSEKLRNVLPPESGKRKAAHYNLPEVPTGMLPSEENIIIRQLGQDDDVFEYGCGGTTLLFSRYVNSYHAVECDSKKYADIQPYLDYLDHLKVAHLSNANEQSPLPLSKQFLDAPGQTGKLYDHIIVGGPDRIACAKAAKKYLKKEGLVYIHCFFTRPSYWALVETDFDIVGAAVVEPLKWLKQHNKQPLGALTLAVLKSRNDKN